MINVEEATLEEIQQAGLDALMRELGPVGLIRFLQQYSNGHGDYTAERHQWLGQETVASVGERILREQGTYRSGDHPK